MVYFGNLRLILPGCNEAIIAKLANGSQILFMHVIIKINLADSWHFVWDLMVAICMQGICSSVAYKYVSRPCRSSMLVCYIEKLEEV